VAREWLKSSRARLCDQKLRHQELPPSESHDLGMRNGINICRELNRRDGGQFCLCWKYSALRHIPLRNRFFWNRKLDQPPKHDDFCDALSRGSGQQNYHGADGCSEVLGWELRANDYFPDQGHPRNPLLDHHIYNHYVADFSLHTLLYQLDCHYERNNFVSVSVAYTTLSLTSYIEC
jgi:hypothetical protein